MLETIFNKVAGLQVCNLIKEILQHRFFPGNIAKFLWTAFFIEHCRLLYSVQSDAVALRSSAKNYSKAFRRTHKLAIKKWLRKMCFSVNFVRFCYEIFWSSSSTEHLWAGIVDLQSFTKYLILTPVFMWIAHYGKGLTRFNPLMYNVSKWSDRHTLKSCKIFNVCLIILGHYELKG